MLPSVTVAAKQQTKDCDSLTRTPGSRHGRQLRTPGLAAYNEVPSGWKPLLTGVPQLIKHLRIRHFVLIEDLTLDLTSGLCLLTGETGAGKSLLIDAVIAALGGRVSLDVIQSGHHRAVIEMTLAREAFDPVVKSILDAEGIEVAMPGELTVSREIAARGTRCRIEGQQVTQATLRQVGRSLIDIATQNEHQSLMDSETHLALLDRFGNLSIQKEAVKTAYEQWRALTKEREQWQKEAQERLNQADFWRFQLDEISRANLADDDEIEQLQQERLKLSHAEKLAHVATGAYDALYAGETQPSLCDGLGRVIAALESQSGLDVHLGHLASKLREQQAQLRDIADDLRHYGEDVEGDPERLQVVQERLDTLRHLDRKYGPGLDTVMAHARELEHKLFTLDTNRERAQTLEPFIAAAMAGLEAASAQLGESRGRAARALEAAIALQMQELELANGRFDVSLSRRDWHPDGVETCEFLVALNPGEAPKPLHKTASGGEMARLMLALKTVLAKLAQTPTLIFDEVDTGISGRAAQAVAEKIAQLAHQHQLICITHLPAVAAMADQHLHLSKAVVSDRTAVHLRSLDRDGRIAELATLASGNTGTAALDYARDLLNRAESFKKGLAQASEVTI
jgi:DNA repair protein RecN (Recombination protein N)